MFEDTTELNANTAPNFPVPSPYLQMALPQPAHPPYPGGGGQKNPSVMLSYLCCFLLLATHAESQQRRKLEAQTWDLTESVAPPTADV